MRYVVVALSLLMVACSTPESTQPDPSIIHIGTAKLPAEEAGAPILAMCLLGAQSMNPTATPCFAWRTGATTSQVVVPVGPDGGVPAHCVFHASEADADAGVAAMPELIPQGGDAGCWIENGAGSATYYADNGATAARESLFSGCSAETTCSIVVRGGREDDPDYSGLHDEVDVDMCNDFRPRDPTVTQESIVDVWLSIDG